MSHFQISLNLYSPQHEKVFPPSFPEAEATKD